MTFDKDDDEDDDYKNDNEDNNDYADNEEDRNDDNKTGRNEQPLSQFYSLGDSRT